MKKGGNFMKKSIKLLSLLLVFAFVFCACSNAESDASDTTEEQLSETETIAQEILTEIQGRLKNPDSFKVKSVSYVDASDYSSQYDNEIDGFKYLFYVEYAGENGFGGTTVNDCYVKYSEDLDDGSITFYYEDDNDLTYMLCQTRYTLYKSAASDYNIDLTKIAKDSLSDITYENYKQ